MERVPGESSVLSERGIGNGNKFQEKCFTSGDEVCGKSFHLKMERVPGESSVLSICL